MNTLIVVALCHTKLGCGLSTAVGIRIVYRYTYSLSLQL